MKKLIEESRCEQTQIVLAGHLNGFNRLFGGILLEWIDIVGAVVARRFSKGEVTTKKFSEVVFEAPACLNDIVVLKGEILKVGTTSMTILVQAFVETPSSKVHTKITSAEVVMVAIDENGRPRKIEK